MARSLAILFDDLGLDPRPVPAGGHRGVAGAGAPRELFAAGLEWRPGALAALRAVRAAGWPTALVTNTGRALTEMALDGIGREHFDVTVCGDEVPRGQARSGPVPARGRAARGAGSRTAWRSRTPRRACWRRSGRARRCSWCRARSRWPAGPRRTLRALAGRAHRGRRAWTAMPGVVQGHRQRDRWTPRASLSPRGMHRIQRLPRATLSHPAHSSARRQHDPGRESSARRPHLTLGT